MLPVTMPKDGIAPSTDVGSTSAAGDFRVRLHHDLSAVTGRWRALEGGGRTTAFQRLDWAALVAEHLAPDGQTRLFVVEVTDRGGRPLLLLPLAARRQFGVRTIVGLDLDVCDYTAPVVAPDYVPTAEAMAAVWTAVRRALPPADLLRLTRMPALAGGAGNPLLLLPGNRPMDMRRYGLPISLPPDNLIQRVTRSSTFRDMAKFQRRLERRGAVSFTPASTPDEVDAIMVALTAQRGERFAEMGRYNLLDRPEIRRFYSAAAHDGLKDGPARLFGLSVEGEWVATAYGLVSGNEFCLLIQTMAGGEWRNCSPGVLVSARTMEWAASAGLTYFDFSIGHLPYKVDLGGVEGELFEHVEALSPLGAAALGWTRLAEDGKAALRRHPALFERLRAVRRRLRRLGRRGPRGQIEHRFNSIGRGSAP